VSIVSFEKNSEDLRMATEEHKVSGFFRVSEIPSDYVCPWTFNEWKNNAISFFNKGDGSNIIKSVQKRLKVLN
jgi:hypothetical protein